jgi:chemotaxis protein CheX
MQDKDIEVFIAGARRYFESLGSDFPVLIEPPFLKKDNRPFLELTGMIDISGQAHGAVGFTATRAMLESILKSLNEDWIDQDAASDLVGEIANTLSGNAREEFGSEFKISVPVVLRNQEAAVRFPKENRNYVIPVMWRGEKAYLLVSVQKTR